MTLAFTICSNNYISQAKALADSVKRHNPNVIFYICLADKFEQIPDKYRKAYEPYNILEVKNLGIPNFDWMNSNYDIIEFNTSIKPYCFQYFFNKHQDVTKLIFLDPDIVVYDSLISIEKNLATHNIILTPHLTQPIEDSRLNFTIHEHDILNHGIFNLGFVAINNSSESKRFINWWADRLAEQCKHDLCNGLFVDQLWCNLVPCYFEKVLIDKNLGMNMAYWNLQERVITKVDGQYLVNGTDSLLFFHFSTFNPEIEDNIAAKQNRYKLSQRNDLQELYRNYEETVKLNHFYELKGLQCQYGRRPKPVKRYKRVRALITKPMRGLVQFIEETI
ncbi:MAG: hypothetical protein ACI9IP_000148 [Arcticibacterium sp.]|jgi:hypothetical protein